jgi:hypothetical protein
MAATTVDATFARSERAWTTTPHVGPIVSIHRGANGYVCFGRKVHDNGWQNLPSIPVAKLETMFPEFVADLTRDSYFTLNTFWKPERQDVTFLNACWVDIDLHRPGEMHTLGQRYGALIDMVSGGMLPRPSVTVYSGRGMWFLWLLVERSGHAAPQRAFPEKCLLQEEINCRLKVLLGGDAVSDRKRMVRVPGSTNTKAEPEHELVRFLFDVDASGRVAEYTLAQLADFLGLDGPGLRKPRSERSERGLTGWKALYAQRFTIFNQLWSIRGRFSEGCRNWACYCYGVILRGYGLDEPTVHQELEKLAAACDPPLSRSEITSAFRESKKSRGQIRNCTISRKLLVTPEEGYQIPEWAPNKIIKEVEPADMHLAYGQDRIRFRKAAIIAIVDRLGRVPSTRSMAQLLAARGISVSHVQISKDYGHMKLKSGAKAAAFLPYDSESAPPLLSSQGSSPGPSPFTSVKLLAGTGKSR